MKNLLLASMVPSKYLKKLDQLQINWNYRLRLAIASMVSLLKKATGSQPVSPSIPSSLTIDMEQLVQPAVVLAARPSPIRGTIDLEVLIHCPFEVQLILRFSFIGTTFQLMKIPGSPLLQYGCSFLILTVRTRFVLGWQVMIGP